MLDLLPEGFVQTREELHRIAEETLKPAREAVNGRFGLRVLPGGFGTPPFGDVMQVHVEGTDLVTRESGDVRREPIEGIDPDAAEALAEWFAFAAGVLEELVAEAGTESEPSLPQLWPEHFDVAVELGSDDAGARAGYGASPGDEAHSDPYLYVTPWTARPTGELWNASGFPGAELPYAELIAAADRRETALAFFRARRDALNTG